MEDSSHELTRIIPSGCRSVDGRFLPYPSVRGSSVRRGSMKQAPPSASWFGGFQALMPFLGYLLGITFSSLITSIDHWIAFVLLAFIGFNMIREARSDEENESNDRFDFKTMLPLAVATSIDALAVGVTFAFLRVNIVPAVSFIGCITFLLSRNRFKGRQHHRRKNRSRAEFAGGLVLILMGIKILLEHLGVISF